MTISDLSLNNAKMSIQCPRCGQLNGEDVAVCTRCGDSLDPEAQAQSMRLMPFELHERDDAQDVFTSAPSEDVDVITSSAKSLAQSSSKKVEKQPVRAMKSRRHKRNRKSGEVQYVPGKGMVGTNGKPATPPPLPGARRAGPPPLPSKKGGVKPPPLPPGSNSSNETPSVPSESSPTLPVTPAAKPSTPVVAKVAGPAPPASGSKLPAPTPSVPGDAPAADEPTSSPKVSAVPPEGERQVRVSALPKGSKAPDVRPTNRLRDEETQPNVDPKTLVNRAPSKQEKPSFPEVEQFGAMFAPDVEQAIPTRQMNRLIRETFGDGGAADATQVTSNPLTRKQPQIRLGMVGPEGDISATYAVGTRTIIGRTNGDVLVQDPSVSPWHAQIRATAEGLELVDMNSLNGTYVQLTAETALRDGDIIVIGQRVLRFRNRWDDNDSACGTLPFGAGDTLPAERLEEVRQGGYVLRVHPLSARVTIGSAGDIAWSEDELHDVEAQVETRDGHWLIRDEGSSSGVFVRCTGAITLIDGDCFQVGHTRFQVMY